MWTTGSAFPRTWWARESMSWRASAWYLVSHLLASPPGSGSWLSWLQLRLQDTPVFPTLARRPMGQRLGPGPGGVEFREGQQGTPCPARRELPGGFRRVWRVGGAVRAGPEGGAQAGSLRGPQLRWQKGKIRRVVLWPTLPRGAGSRGASGGTRAAWESEETNTCCPRAAAPPPRPIC